MADTKRVLILGSGFSKAVNDVMPLVGELAPCLREEQALREEPYASFANDPEMLLSYLGLNQPWKEPAEGLGDQELFVRVQQRLADRIADCEGQAFRTPHPEWAGSLVKHLHDTRIPVITLNYDTVVERLVRRSMKGETGHEPPGAFDLYNLPLSILRLRQAGTVGRGEEVETFHLIKLHGSINWFYSGADGFPGEQVYYRAVTSDSPAKDDWGRARTTDREVKRLCQDKIPLIIPPVAEKSRFYENRTVRALWVAARKALVEANEILCVGYSLPETDLTMKLFLRAFAHPKKVTVVNKEHANKEDLDEMLKRYQEAFLGAEIDAETFVCEGSVQKMTDSLLS